MTPGPVQVLVLGFDDATHFDGSALAELARLGDAGVVRLVDLLVVRRAADGSVETVDGVFEGYGAVAAALLDGAADPGGRPARVDPGSWSLGEAVPRGGLAVVALIEHRWAGPLTAALRSSGAALLEETWLSADDRALLTSLEEQATTS